MKEVTNPGKKGNKKKTNKNEIHKSLLPLARENRTPARPSWGVCLSARNFVKRLFSLALAHLAAFQPALAHPGQDLMSAKHRGGPALNEPQISTKTGAPGLDSETWESNNLPHPRSSRAERVEAPAPKLEAKRCPFPIPLFTNRGTPWPRFWANRGPPLPRLHSESSALNRAQIRPLFCARRRGPASPGTL